MGKARLHLTLSRKAGEQRGIHQERKSVKPVAIGRKGKTSGRWVETKAGFLSLAVGRETERWVSRRSVGGKWLAGAGNPIGNWRTETEEGRESISVKAIKEQRQEN